MNTTKTPSQTPQSTPDKDGKGASADGCPPWAEDLINQIVAIEVELGNITKEKDWTFSTADSLSAQAFDPASTKEELANRVDLLFEKLSKALHEQGHDPEQISGFVNNRAKSESSRLPYCNAAEVNLVLK